MSGSPSGVAATRAGPILGVTISCSDVEASSATYAEALGYVVVHRGTFGEDEALAFDAPASAGRPLVVLAPGEPLTAARAGVADAGDGDGDGDATAERGLATPLAPGAPLGVIRLVEGRRPAGFAPLRHHGWAAAELAVTDADAVTDRLQRSPFQVLRAPAPLRSTSSLRAVQVAGPDGEVLYLTQQLRPLEAFDVPVARRLVDRVFIAVLAASDLERARHLYVSGLGATQASDHPVEIGVLNDAFGLPPGTAHRLSSVQLDGQCLVEIDQYPQGARAGISSDGELPWGVAAVSLGIPPVCEPLRLGARLDALAGRGASSRARPGGLDWAGRLVCWRGKGAEGELVEVVLQEPESAHSRSARVRDGR